MRLELGLAQQKSVQVEQIEHSVVVRFDDELGAGTVNRGPAQTHRVLVGEIAIGFDEIALHQIVEATVLLLDGRLRDELLVRRNVGNEKNANEPEIGQLFGGHCLAMGRSELVVTDIGCDYEDS